MTDNEALEILKDSGALLEGHFELRSKLHSNRYFQCANVLRYPRKAALLCEELVRRMQAATAGRLQADAVISPAMGGILVGHEIARVFDLMSIFAEKVDGRLVMHRFSVEKGRRYIVAEDVVTRGGRVQEVIDLVEKAGGRVVAVAVLVDRSGGKAVFSAPLFSLLKIEAETYEPSACPMCAQGSRPVHPGS